MKRDLDKWRAWKRRGRKSSAEWARRTRSRLDRNSGLSRGKRIRPRNPERLHRKRGGEPGSEERHTYGRRFEFVSGLPCCVCGTVDGAPADHWKTVGALGRDNWCIPICAKHNDHHELGRDTWADTYEVDVPAVLERTREAWRQHVEEGE